MLREQVTCASGNLNVIELFDDNDQVVITFGYNRDDPADYDDACKYITTFKAGYKAGRFFSQADR